MTPPPRPPPPVPKPRARYLRDSRTSSLVLNRETNHEVIQRTVSSGGHPNTDQAPPPPSAAVTLESVTDIIIANIPSLAGIAGAIGSSAPSPPSAPSDTSALSAPSVPLAPSAPSAPHAPPSVDTLADNIANSIPALADVANSSATSSAAVVTPDPSTTPAANAPVANKPVANTPVANPTEANTTVSDAPAASTGVASFDRLFSSLAKLPGLAGLVSDVPNSATSTPTSEDSPTEARPRPSEENHTYVGESSQLTAEGAPGSTKKGSHADLTHLTPGEEHIYETVLSSWASQEDPDTESSNEEEEAGRSSAPSGKEELAQEDPPSNSTSSNQSRHVITTPPDPPPSRTPNKSERPPKQKIPRAATIRVSRKKGASRPAVAQSAVVRASWLDVWKGFRHSVYWVTLDGHLMSLWKKRSDRFSEVMFHVSSVTNVKKQDKGRFSIYFRKKHYDFMAQNDEVQECWLTSLAACRGQPSPGSSELHGPVTIKDPRSRAYAALWGHSLWIYPNKDGYQLGVATFTIHLNVASVKPSGRHSLSLITPYKTLNLSVDSSKEQALWVEVLSSTIQNALSCSQVSQRLWENPFNKVCGDCGAANPEWASVNLLLVVCHECAGHHRALSSNLSKVRSLTMDTKAWTEPVQQLFVAYGNRLANQVWGPAVPAAEQLQPEATEEERSKFIKDKYSRGRYKRVHPLSSSPSMMEQRLLQVVCSDNVEETMSLICSGVKVSPSDPQSPSPILLAEKANQPLQTELLRLNEYTEIPPHQPESANRSSGEEEEALHGKLEEDRFLLSSENDSAACDVLDLKEVHSVFLRDGPSQEFELVALSGPVICTADDRDGLLEHMSHILKVILPEGVSHAEVGGASAVSKVYVVDVGGASHHSDAWLMLWEDQVSIHPLHRDAWETIRFPLSTLSHHEMMKSENITMATPDRSVSLRFEDQGSCLTWFNHLQSTLANLGSAPPRPPSANPVPAPQHPLSANQGSVRLYPMIDVGLKGSVPPAIERCVSHVTAYGLKVEGIYRRCGIATKVSQLVEALTTSPKTAPLESNEQGVLDAGSALKQYVRQQDSLVPTKRRKQWVDAAVIPDEGNRFKEYRRLLRQLPDDNRATLNALFGHFYMIQVFSQVNKMSAHNLAVVLVPSLFQCLNQNLIKLSKEFIIHHTLLFLTPSSDQEEEEFTVL